MSVMMTTSTTTYMRSVTFDRNDSPVNDQSVVADDSQSCFLPRKTPTFSGIRDTYPLCKRSVFVCWGLDRGLILQNPASARTLRFFCIKKDIGW